MKKTMIVAMMALSTLAANAKTETVDTLVVTTTPVMHCEGCENKIKKNIRFVKGTKKITTSVPEQRVTIIYDNRKSGFDDFVSAFRKIGFEISVPENSDAKTEE